MVTVNNTHLIRCPPAGDSGTPQCLLYLLVVLQSHHTQLQLALNNQFTAIKTAKNNLIGSLRHCESTDPKQLGSCLDTVFLWSVVLKVGVVDHTEFGIGRRHSKDSFHLHYLPATVHIKHLTHCTNCNLLTTWCSFTVHISEVLMQYTSLGFHCCASQTAIHWYVIAHHSN